MIVRDSVFDLLLFGVLALALALDLFFGAHLHGVATVLAVGLATYLAAQELSRGLARRSWWTQESLATSVALSVAGFLYYWRGNQADVILVALSLGFMMTSLMLLIAAVAAVGAALHGKGAQPLVGWLATFAGALALGVAAGLLILVLTSDLPYVLRFGLLAIGFAAAKMREVSKSRATVSAQPNLRQSSTRTTDAEQTAHMEAALNTGGWSLRPERGTLLDRFVPILLLGALAFAFLLQTHRNSAWPAAPAQASDASVPDASANVPAASSSAPK